MDYRDEIYRRAKLQLIGLSNSDISVINQEVGRKAIGLKPPPKSKARPIFQSKKDKIFKLTHKLAEAHIPLPKLRHSLQIQAFKLPALRARLSRPSDRAINIEKGRRWKSVPRERIGVGGMRGLYISKAVCQSFS